MHLHKKLPFLLFLLLFGKLIPAVYAQDFFTFINYSRLYVYDQGAIRQLEHMPVTSFRSGYSFAAFTTNTRQFKVSIRKTTEVLSDFIPTRRDTLSYTITGSMMGYVMNQTLYSYWNGRKKVLGGFAGAFNVTDSMIAFFDYAGYFMVFYNGSVTQLEIRQVRNYNQGKNIIAYTNENSLFKIFYADSIYTIDVYEPRSIKTGLNTVAYLDAGSRLNLFYKGMLYNIEELEPTFYHVGDNVVVWANRNLELWAFYNGMMYKLESYIPRNVRVTDGLVYYTDGNNFLKVFDRGESHIVEMYDPGQVQVRNNTLGFLDRYNHLKIYRDGKTRDVSAEVVNSFGIPGDVVWYQAQARDLVIIDRRGEKVRITLVPR